MRQRYCHNSHICGAIAIILLICDHQDSESEWWEMEMSILQPIFTHKYCKGSMRKLYPYSAKSAKTIVVSTNINGSLAMFLIFCDHQDTEYD